MTKKPVTVSKIYVYFQKTLAFLYSCCCENHSSRLSPPLQFTSLPPSLFLLDVSISPSFICVFLSHHVHAPLVSRPPPPSSLAPFPNVSLHFSYLFPGIPKGQWAAAPRLQIRRADQERCVPKIGLREHPQGEITSNSKERP